MSNQQCLSPLRKGIQIETNDPTELDQKQEIFSGKHFSDVVLPRNCEQPARMWLDTQPKMFQYSARSILDILEKLGSDPVVLKVMI